MNKKNEYDNLLHDLDFDFITSFIDVETYNEILNEDKNHIRIVLESLNDALVELKKEEVNEVAFNEDGTLWAYGVIGAIGKRIVGRIRPPNVDEFDYSKKIEVVKKYKISVNDLGIKSKVYLSDEEIDPLDEIHEEKTTEYKRITHADDGTPYLTPLFNPEKAMKALATLYNAQIHSLSPMLEVVIPYLGHRFSGAISPVHSQASFSIRTKPRKIFSLHDLVNQGVMNESQMKSIVNYIKQKKNILIVGGTSSGKTTLVNALLLALSNIDQMTRMFIIEDTRELQCSVIDKNYLTVPPPSSKSATQITIANLIRHAMRRTPDRICVGEIRDGEAATQLLSAWNSGHPGGFSTIHAESAEGGLLKMEQYLDMDNKKINHKMIASTINVVISIQKDFILDKETKKEKGLRRIKEIVEVKGYIAEKNEYDLV